MDLQLSRKGKQRQEAEDSTGDPTQSLTKALAKFKEVLTTEQKKQFEDSTAVPDAGSVLFFVAQLDAENASKTRRSIAPRLCTFLTATQQFAGAVETFVSSNPQTAALIWGGIKTAITVASNVASYFDKVTNMIKDIGLTCPTIQQFGQLYHGHVGLQRSLCEYYAVIIELCSKVIEVSRRGSALQTVSSIWNPFESEFKLFLDRLASSITQVTWQVSLASKQAAQEAKLLLEYESKENSVFRPSTLKFLRRSAHQQEEARQWQINQTKREKASLKTKVRQNLSPIDHIQPWKRILKQRVQSTAEWLVQEDAFIAWSSSPDTSILWCCGTMGMGKTVLMSNVVSFLHSSRRENESVAHFFCQTDNEPSLSSRNIVGSICRQLLDSLIEESSRENLLSIQNETKSMETDETVQFLLSRLVKERTYYIVLDGLDECASAQIREMARFLEAISQATVGTLKIICASRPDLEGDLFKKAQPQHRIAIDKGKLAVDMDRYIAATLDDCVEEGLLVIRDQKIVTTIMDALRDGSQGM
jgi:Cdc6-like AAA superfamily ATPase